jgi:hypothetical protein
VAGTSGYGGGSSSHKVGGAALQRCHLNGGGSRAEAVGRTADAASSCPTTCRSRGVLVMAAHSATHGGVGDKSEGGSESPRSTHAFVIIRSSRSGAGMVAPEIANNQSLGILCTEVLDPTAAARQQPVVRNPLY